MHWPLNIKISQGFLVITTLKGISTFASPNSSKTSKRFLLNELFVAADFLRRLEHTNGAEKPLPSKSTASWFCWTTTDVESGVLETSSTLLASKETIPGSNEEGFTTPAAGSPAEPSRAKEERRESREVVPPKSTLTGYTTIQSNLLKHCKRAAIVTIQRTRRKPNNCLPAKLNTTLFHPMNNKENEARK
jgi:hypothetical protein